MARQTSGDAKNKIIFPDGFKMEVKLHEEASEWVDVGFLEGGGTAALNYDEMLINAGNYRKLIDYGVNPTVALSPTNVLVFDPDVIEVLSPGYSKTEDVSIDEGVTPAGKKVEYAGSKRYFKLKHCEIRLTHFTKDIDDETLDDDDFDWRFHVKHAKFDAGLEFTFTGANEEALSSISVSFTGECDPADESKLFEFFRATAT